VKKPTARLDAWVEVHKRFHLSDLPIQMARELGLNPKKFGGLATHRQEPWKLPLPEFIAEGCKSPHKHLRVKQLSEGWRLDELVELLPPSTPLSVRHPLGRFGS
jgi:hypothetical protein